MYISIKLPPAFGSFNKLRKENYPFNNLFTTYLAAVCRLGLALQVDVEELVGYIEDCVFDGQRVPDVPDGDEPVNIRYKTEDPDVVKYISSVSTTNRNAVMYIARMTLRLSEAYGMSLFRLTRLINDLIPLAGAKKSVKARVDSRREQSAYIEEHLKREPVKPATRAERLAEQISEHETEQESKREVLPKPEQKPKEESIEEPAPMAMPRISNKSAEQPKPATEQQPAAVNTSAEAAKAALNDLNGLLDRVQDDNEIVETNPALKDFL